MNGEHWDQAPSIAPVCRLTGVTQLSDGYQVCRQESVGRSNFLYHELINLTNVHPDVGPINDTTVITIIGEGFRSDPHLAVKLVPRSIDSARIANVQVMSGGGSEWQGWDGEGLLAFNASVLDPFTIVAVIPPFPWADLLMGDGRINVTVDVRVALNGRDFSSGPMPFYYLKLWTVLAAVPWQGRMTGGSIITVFGPYFRETKELMCSFGDYPATSASFLTISSIQCRTPSVIGHGRMSVEVP